MSEFVQFHMLTAYPASNLNRDDLGRPKTMVFGGAQRLRVSSQSLKRAWRCSDAFAEALVGHLGTRSRVVATERVLEPLLRAGLEEAAARAIADKVAARFGKASPKRPGTEQIAHYSVEDLLRIDALVARAAAGAALSDKDYDALLDDKDHNTVDVALFGRMLADTPRFNVDAAAQVAHAMSVHKVAVEDDFFTAVDDLNRHEEDAGAAMMGSVEFAAPLLYLYVCVDRTQLVENLGGNAELATRALRALLRTAATVGPTGKQNTFASRAWASYVGVERGSAQPRSLAVSFLRPVAGEDQLASAIQALEDTRAAMDRAYGPAAERTYRMSVSERVGSLDEALEFLG